MSYQFQSVAVTRADGQLSIFSVYTTLPIGALAADLAAPNAFAAEERAGVWVREATDAVIQMEIDAYHGFAGHLGWRRIEPADLPADRMNRGEWRDTGVVTDALAGTIHGAAGKTPSNRPATSREP